ncbi:MAG TPA: site-specific DNA-methyltransferase [Verrucomicrobiae bacterium]|nr:site-specific DNA-methyltransferase [Verrucomicrobiae bacterium]
MPRKKTSPKNQKPLYRRKPPESLNAKGQTLKGAKSTSAFSIQNSDFPHGHVLPPSHFTLRDDGAVAAVCDRRNEERRSQSAATIPNLIFQSDSPFLRLYHGNCLELLDAIAAKYPEGRFDAIFADPPYFLSNGGITCHAGRMVRVDKGDWDISRGPELNHEFNLEWLRRCQRVLKPNGTIWVSGTHHVIFSIGYAMQQLGYKILNDIAWEKPNPPPNLSCRYFTHSTETILWAAKNEKSKHLFNYQDMRKVTGKQMKTVWRKSEFEPPRHKDHKENSEEKNLGALVPSWLESVWTMSAPGNDEKQFGKHPTQKPVALIERCLLASTREDDLVLDPFLGGGTTAIAAMKLKRGVVGIELDEAHAKLAAKRMDAEIIFIWLRHFRVSVTVGLFSQLSTINNQLFFDLDLFSETINGSRCMADVPQIETDRIYHETKFVFLSCAEVQRGTVVHTTVDVSLQEAWAKTPNGKKRETTHVVRCETEIFRIK